MGNCYLTDHIVEGHIHTDITCNIEEHNRSTALERSAIDEVCLKIEFFSENLKNMKISAKL